MNHKKNLELEHSLSETTIRACWGETYHSFLDQQSFPSAGVTLIYRSYQKSLHLEI